MKLAVLLAGILAVLPATQAANAKTGTVLTRDVPTLMRMVCGKLSKAGDLSSIKKGIIIIQQINRNSYDGVDIARGTIFFKIEKIPFSLTLYPTKILVHGTKDYKILAQKLLDNKSLPQRRAVGVRGDRMAETFYFYWGGRHPNGVSRSYIKFRPEHPSSTGYSNMNGRDVSFLHCEKPYTIPAP